MSIKRASQTAINWANIYKRLPPHLFSDYKDIKGRSDNLISKISSLPSDLPKIDWEMYRKAVPIKGMVEKFQKEYDGYKVPEPKDIEDWNTKLSADEKNLIKLMDEFKVANLEIDKVADQLLAAISKLPPASQLCLEIRHAFYPWTTLHEKETAMLDPPTRTFIELHKRKEEKKPFFRYSDEE